MLKKENYLDVYYIDGNNELTFIYRWETRNCLHSSYTGPTKDQYRTGIDWVIAMNIPDS